MIIEFIIFNAEIKMKCNFVLQVFFSHKIKFSQDTT